jgi:hypothetical protein
VRADLEQRLIERFPKIFGADQNPDMTLWGIECEDGWFPLIYNLCGAIQSYLDSNRLRGMEQVVATQIKEKYGTLSFYYQGGDEMVEGMVWFAQYLSACTCEATGQTGRLMVKGGWYKTLSPDVAAERGFEEPKR